MMMSLAMKIREKAKQLRVNQQEELARNKYLESYQTKPQNLMNKDEEDIWLDEEEFGVMENKMMKERNE